MQKRTIESIDPIGGMSCSSPRRVAPESSEKSRLTAAPVDRLECNQVHEQINDTSNATGANEADEI